MEKRSATCVLQVRVDDRLRYLLNLAMATTGDTLTDFVADAVKAKFESISLYKRGPVERVYGENKPDWPELYDAEEEQVNREALNLAKQADVLWSESNITRMQMLDLIAPHLMSADDRAILAFVESLDEYKVPRGNVHVLDRQRIDREWPAIQKQFAAHQKSTKKAGK